MMSSELRDHCGGGDVPDGDMGTMSDGSGGDEDYDYAGCDRGAEPEVRSNLLQNGDPTPRVDAGPLR